MESMVASNTSAVDNLDVLEVMNEYSHSALNINQATLETLEQFPPSPKYRLMPSLNTEINSGNSGALKNYKY